MADEIISVSELNRRVRSSIERAMPLSWVAGEISNLVRAASGHIYFTLKDAGAQVRCVMFRSRAQLVPWQLANGQQVEANALASLYEPRGDFQLNVEGLRRAGLGQLYEAFLRLRQKLDAEGLFNTASKRALPRYPNRIGIITSPQAAALRDVVAAFARRAPHVELVIYPALVQGTEAPAAIVSATLSAARRAECDVVLIVRGGGSLEDLWAFNDETVARAIAASPIPTISGVGHETDTTIADYVADHRAATPTAAAELASAGWFDAAAETAALGVTLRNAMQQQLDGLMQRIDLLAHHLVHPAQRLQALQGRIAHLATRLAASARLHYQSHSVRLQSLQLRHTRGRIELSPRRHVLQQLHYRLERATAETMALRKTRLAGLNAALSALNPQATLARGFAIVRDESGKLLSDASLLRPSQTIRLQFAHGAADALVTRTVPD